MHTTTFIAAIVASVVASTSAARGDAFAISAISVDRVLGANVTLSFTVYDDDINTNASATCSGTWTVGSKDYPIGRYALCPDSTFGWRIDKWRNYQKFTLGLNHAYNDPDIGGGVITFARALVNRTNLACTKDAEGYATCEQKREIAAPIYAISS